MPEGAVIAGGGPAPADPMVPRPVRVRSVLRETPDVVSLELGFDRDPDRDPEGGPDGPATRLPFAPGQFTMVYAFAAGEVPLSISGDPARPEVLRHTVRGVGPVTRAIAAAGPGTVLGVRGPFGRGWPLGDAAGGDVVLVGGGIGLAPLLPAVHAIAAARARYRRVSVVAGARTPRDLPFAGELAGLARTAGLDLACTVDAASPGWTGEVGPVTVPSGRLDLDPAATTLLTCGPEIMMRVVARAAVERGVDPGRVHLSVERNMKCAIGRCGRCQLGPRFTCTDGPVWSLAELAPLLEVAER